MTNLKQFLRKWSIMQIPVYAGNAAFFLLLSIFPVAILLLSLLPYVPLSAEDLGRFFGSIAPAQVYPLLRLVYNDFLLSHGTPGVSAAAAAAALWAAAKSVISLLSGLNSVYGLRETRPLLLRWIYAVLCAILFFVSVITTMLLQLYGESLAAFFMKKLPQTIAVLYPVLQFRNLFSFGFLSILFAFFYFALPNRQLSFLPQLPGAMASSLGWMLFSRLFGWLVGIYGRGHYGSLTSVMMTILWLYFCLIIFFCGALFNRYLCFFRKTHRRKTL